MHTDIHYLVTLVQTHWQVWLEWLLSGGAVWLVTEIKKGFKAFETAKAAQRFVFVVSGLAWLADWFYKYYPTHFSSAVNPIWVVPGAAGLFTIATFIHHSPLKKLTGALADSVSLRWRAYRLAVKEFEAEVQSANAVSSNHPEQTEPNDQANPFETAN